MFGVGARQGSSFYVFVMLYAGEVCAIGKKERVEDKPGTEGGWVGFIDIWQWAMGKGWLCGCGYVDVFLVCWLLMGTQSVVKANEGKSSERKREREQGKNTKQKNKEREEEIERERQEERRGGEKEGGRRAKEKKE